MPNFNPIPYTLAAGIGASEGYHFGHKEDRGADKTHALVGAALGLLGGPLGVHAATKQWKDLKVISQELGHEAGLLKKAVTQFPSLKDVPKISDNIKDESPARSIASIGTGTGIGLGAYYALKRLKAPTYAAALAGFTGAVGGDTGGGMLYDRLLEKHLSSSKHKYVRQMTKVN